MRSLYFPFMICWNPSTGHASAQVYPDVLRSSQFSFDPVEPGNALFHGYPAFIVSFLSLLAKVRIGAYHTARDRRRASSGVWWTPIRGLSKSVTAVQSASSETKSEDNPFARSAAFRTFQAASAERCDVNRCGPALGRRQDR